jgi:sec-independent protein translocase protein TatA
VFGITGFKWIIILIAAMVLIGPDKLPEIARTVGKGIRMFTAAKDEMESLIKADMFAGDKPESTILTTETTTTASTLYADDAEDEEEEEQEE